MSKPSVRTGTLEELSKLFEQEELEYGRPTVHILRQQAHGPYMEVFNSYTGLNVATLAEIEGALERETRIAEDVGSPESREKRLNILRDARIERLADMEKAERELKKSIIPNGGEVSTQVVASVVEQIMRPMLESMGSLMKRMSEAVEHIATAQDVMRNRLEALEKESRLNTPVTDTQARYLAAAAKDKAVDILSRKGMTDKKAITKLAGMIRKAVLQRYGKGSLREIPRCEYGVAMSQIESWNKATEVAKIVLEAQARQEEERIHEANRT